MNLQRIIAVIGSAVLATALVVESHAQAEQHESKGAQSLDTTVYFSFDSAELDAESKQKLDETVRWLEDNPERVVVVAGYTDQTGTEDYNLVLGKERARQTRQYLVSQGIDPDRIITVSFGEEFPASDIPAKNRRTVFYATRPAEGATQQPSRDDRQERYQQERYQRGAAPDEQQQEGAERDAEFLDMDMESETEQRLAGLFGGQGKRARDLWMTRNGMSIGVGGGVIGFLDSDTMEFTAPGPAWDVRFTYGTRSRVALEAAYFGSVHDLDVPETTGDASLLATGFEGNVRVNILRLGKFQPYLLSGIGWTHYSMRGAGAATAARGGEDLLHVPFALGVGFRAFGNFLADVRGGVRAAFADQMRWVPPEDRAGADLSTWAVTARLGWEF